MVKQNKSAALEFAAQILVGWNVEMGREGKRVALA